MTCHGPCILYNKALGPILFYPKQTMGFGVYGLGGLGFRRHWFALPHTYPESPINLKQGIYLKITSGILASLRAYIIYPNLRDMGSETYGLIVYLLYFPQICANFADKLPRIYLLSIWPLNLKSMSKTSPKSIISAMKAIISLTSGSGNPKTCNPYKA